LVKRVVDGDTLLLRDGRRVRLIGVDTPEVHASQKLHRDVARTGKDAKTIRALGKRSSNFVKELVAFKPVKLEFDPANQHSNHMDKYGRTLAYIYFYAKEPPPGYQKYMAKVHGAVVSWKPDWIMLNRVLVQCGYANAYTRYPFKYSDEFRKHEKEARKAELGLWGS